MATKVLVVSAKGGSGRTTATVLLATSLGEAGLTSGIIDLDPQASASSWISASLKPIPGVEEDIHGHKRRERHVGAPKGHV